MGLGDPGKHELTRARGLRPSLALPLVLTLMLVASMAVGQTQAPAPQSPAPAPAQAQTSTPAPDVPQGKTQGNYVIQESVEAGYRDSLINGNLQNYDTFEDYSSGMRLLDYTFDMRSVNHNGILFDNLSFSNFGYGGDPNDVSRLRVEKNKWYDFRAQFRR